MAERGKKTHFRPKSNKFGRNLHDKTADGRSTKHPSGLKGKEIGLWYAKRNKSKKQQIEKPIQRNVVGMSNEMEWKLSAVLENIKRDTFSMPQKTSISSSTSRSSAGSSKSISFESSPASTSTFESRYLQHKEQCDSNETCSSRLAIRELIQDEELDEKLLNELQCKKDIKSYKAMQEFRRKLPSDASKDKIINTIEENSVVVISGETGCGKTTQVPQFILDHHITNKKGSLCSVICSQPRRISAITVAERVAQERAETCGDGSVGYQIRLENKIPRAQGSILFCTTGIILKWLESDELLQRASHIIIDEVHERDLLTDFLMTIVKKTILKRPSLRVILMSASLNAW